MSAPILRVFGLIVILFTVLIVWTSRWTVLESSALNTNPLNRRVLIDQLRIKRGRIIADDGTVLAKPVPGPGSTWSRFYPTRSLFAQTVGYSIAIQGRAAGLEAFRAPELRGTQRGLSAVFGPLGGNGQIGNDVYTSLDPKAQRLAVQLLAGRAGSVVALNPRTGEVKVMYANPSYDDNRPDVGGAAVSTFNRSTQSGYPPGSTFKVVTATAALDSGAYMPSSKVNGNSPVTISGVPLSNDYNQNFGPIDLTTALTYSVNTVWAQVAVRLGSSTLSQYMKSFGFYSRPPLDYPADELNISRPFSPLGRAYAPGSPNEDVGRIGIGQGGLEVTPLQMAMVVAAVANRGVLMVPHMTTRVVDPDGRTVKTIAPSPYGQVMKASTAAALAQMMRKVVEEGTGTPAQLGGINVAGKTGTASVGTRGSGLTQPWFIGFAPVENPKVAVAVTVERTQGGFGGTVAAPIAKAIIQTLISEGH